MAEWVEVPETRLVIAESDIVLLAEAGKAIGTASLKANVGERDAFVRRNRTVNEIREAIQRSAKHVGPALRRVYNDTRGQLGTIVYDWQSGTITRSEARIRSGHLLRESYERVREIARRAAGLERLGNAREGFGVDPFREEEQWFRDAVREEVRYFHGFMEDIRQGRTVGGQIDYRIEQYVKALRFMYEAARVQAMPDNVLLYWVGPDRRRGDTTICEGCQYIMERSPFPKDVLPACPRDGSTPCLTNCRHRIRVRVVQNINEVVQRRTTIERRDKMIRELQLFKEDAGLGRRAPRTRSRERNPFQGAQLTRRVAPKRRRR